MVAEAEAVGRKAEKAAVVVEESAEKGEAVVGRAEAAALTVAAAEVVASLKLE